MDHPLHQGHVYFIHFGHTLHFFLSSPYTLWWSTNGFARPGSTPTSLTLLFGHLLLHLYSVTSRGQSSPSCLVSDSWEKGTSPTILLSYGYKGTDVPWNLKWLKIGAIVFVAPGRQILLNRSPHAQWKQDCVNVRVGDFAWILPCDNTHGKNSYFISILSHPSCNNI